MSEDYTLCPCGIKATTIITGVGPRCEVHTPETTKAEARKQNELEEELRRKVRELEAKRDAIKASSPDTSALGPLPKPASALGSAFTDTEAVKELIAALKQIAQDGYWSWEEDRTVKKWRSTSPAMIAQKALERLAGGGR